jgi:hypothetical protein
VQQEQYNFGITLDEGRSMAETLMRVEELQCIFGFKNKEYTAENK